MLKAAAALCAVTLNLFTAGIAAAQSSLDSTAIVVAVPSTAGKVDGLSQNSDEFIWNLFSSAVKPSLAAPAKAEFQTWATDNDIYNDPTPAWPSAQAPVVFHGVPLARLRLHNPEALDVPCATPENPYVANFPSGGCIAEEVYRNRTQFDYIVNKHLNTKAGLAAFYATGKPVLMPRESLSIKADWVPVKTVAQWVPQIGTVANVRKNYFVTTSQGVEYALVAMHLSSAYNPAWVWGTFEHQSNPGRCDATGCFDSYGALKPVVPPNDLRSNTQYGNCLKSPQLLAAFARAGLDKVWNNYCLKSTQVSFVTAGGKPTVMANSVTERISANGELISSCISCHSYASFGAAGTPTDSALTMLDYNPVGRVFPSALQDTRSYDFMWGVLNAK